MGDRLEIYRGAARLIGDARIATLTDETAIRYALDDAWQNSVKLLLEQGLWNFAMRTVDIEYDANQEPYFGFKYAFSKPDDWVRTMRISDSDTLYPDFERFHDEGNYWYADQERLYISYVSSGTSWGWNVGAWRQTFCKALEAYLAFQIALAIPDDKGNRNDLFQLYEKALKNAKIKDAIDEQVEYTPRGRLVRSRYGYGARTYRDR